MGDPTEIELDHLAENTEERKAAILQLVPAQRLQQSIEMLDAVRKMILALLVMMFVVGVALAFFFDYVSDSRDEVRLTRERTEQIENGFDRLSDANAAFANEHARTQRLICEWYRSQGASLPDNGDCDNR